MGDQIYVIDGKRFVGTQSEAEAYARRTGKKLQSKLRSDLLKQGIDVETMPVIEQLRQ